MNPLLSYLSFWIIHFTNGKNTVLCRYNRDKAKLNNFDNCDDTFDIAVVCHFKHLHTVLAKKYINSFFTDV